MPQALLTKNSTPTTSERKLSEVAKHLVVPSGIVRTGYPAVAAQCAKMGVEHDGWQRGLGKAILAKRSNGKYAAGIGGVIISICRQVGKTFTIGTIIFALCILFPGLKVLWTAHHGATSDETFDALAALARRRRIKPYILQVRGGNGKQRIKFRNGSQIMFGAREYGFGRGIPGVSIVVFDEAQILKSKALNDMVPAANTVKNPLVIYMGTPPTPDDQGRSDVFKSRRRKALKIEARRKVGEDVRSNTLYVEVGADAGDDPDSHETWAKANPSFPHRTDADAIQRLREQLDDEASFLREGLGIWDEDADGDGPLSKSWPMLAVDAAQVPAQGTRAFGVAFSADGMKVSLGGCIITDERAHVELIDAQQGPVDAALEPLADWFVAKVDGVPRWKRASQIVLSGRAGALVLERMLLDRKVPRRRIVVASTAQYFQACGMLLEQSTAAAREAKLGDAVSLTHLAGDGQSQLDTSAKKSIQEKRSRDGAWGWASPAGDETPVEAVSLALFGARTGRKPNVKRERTGVIL